MTDTSGDAVERAIYLVRKRGSYYRPNEQGYTTSVILAGRYTLSDAQKITYPNGPDGPRDAMTFVHEDDVSDDDFAAYRALLARAEAAEADRDTAWNDAIDAALNAIAGCDRICEAGPALRALKRGK